MNNSPDYYNVYFDTNINSVVLEWHGYSPSKEFREGVELMLNALIQNNSSKLLADIKEMKLIGLDDQLWINNDFLPRAIKSGFKTVAVIEPEDHFNKVAVASIVDKIDAEILNVKFFPDLEDAKTWLKSFDK